MPLLLSRFSPSTQFFPSTTTTTIFLLKHNKKTKIPTIRRRRTSTASMSSFSSPPPAIPSKEEQNSDPQKEEQELLLNQVLKYHNQTKHSFTNYAKGPHGLDWANQPNPFRRYISSPLLCLQHLPPDRISSSTDNEPPLSYSSVFLSLPSPKPISHSTLSQFFYDSLSLSAWKTTGFSTWSLRVNPSSGNLHPTEAYVIAPPISSLSDSSFVAHYAPKEHSLELRSEIPSGFLQNSFPEGSFLVGFSSIFWREAWKYGERAFRYCNHDVGHAIAAVSIAAAELGWDVKLLDGLGYSDLEKLMGLGLGLLPKFKIPSSVKKGRLPEIEFEHPDCVLVVFPNGSGEFTVNYENLSSKISELFSNLEWKGKPNSLSREHVCWDIIYKTAEAVKKPLTSDGFCVNPFQKSGLISERLYKGSILREVIRKRRSAVDMEKSYVMERETFYQILLHCLPSGSGGGEKQGKQLALPFRLLPWDAEVHAVLFVHRVAGLPKGSYFLVRNEDHFDDLKRATRSDFVWEKPEGCPADLPLYRLELGDCQVLAQRLSCHQEIASDGCFSLGMVARFDQTLREKNVWMYPRLFWETGILGQILYLEAHAVGISATGIGCYFDDPVHYYLGLEGSEFQSLYHFTVGSPVIDRRIMSLPAYPGPAVNA
ncbi:Nitroreductase-like [Macleaya cordata]|uniref:Nitroreductase-like n=1 Tax=Macleaya cordata TaxID=56857 RepID=A0A200RA08_MACCD|nr:Nitroreductase-like [Macleaya cordata]